MDDFILRFLVSLIVLVQAYWINLGVTSFSA